jgi:carbonic anhydrase
MDSLDHLLENNKKWAQAVNEKYPGFFEQLAFKQTPKYLWIGCSDSRIPANDATGLLPGELFVHRNIANLVVHSDINCLSVLQFAIEVLKIEHIIVCGHYGCGGVKAALEDAELGLIDNWLRHIQDIGSLYKETLDGIPDSNDRLNRLCELNVIEQVMNTAETTFVQRAWKNGAKVAVHGWIYDLKDGIIRELDVCLGNQQQLNNLRQQFWSVKN